VPSPRTISTLIPARLDRLPWTRFHTMIVIGLGITWILDGLEVTIVGGVSGVLQEKATLGFSAAEIGALASSYLTGAVLGSLAFGWLTDRHGRRLFFFITLATYLLGVLLSAFSWDFWSFAIFRFITGAGIGGEYAAINSAIEVDLTGQVVADSIGYRMYSGVGGQMDFVRGASLATEGKAFIALPSTTSDAVRGIRSATCSTARPSDTLMCSPRNMASRRSGTPDSKASSTSNRMVSSVTRFFE